MSWSTRPGGVEGWARPSTALRSTRPDAVVPRTSSLTSRPSREAANRLYQRIGFEARTTNVYRYTL